MPELNNENVRHLLRRTEYVDRPGRVAHLLSLGSIEAAVDDILDVPASPSTIDLLPGENWEKGHQYSYFWIDQMAHDSPKPVQEKMAFFWHGHFCTSFSKAGSAERVRDQIDLFRREGLGNFRSLSKTMSTQVAMIRYLDNHLNKASSPNQNFARELMELFILGADNYTESDVEAATLAWSGHSTSRVVHTDYEWRSDWHDPAPKQFLGRRINEGSNLRYHGPETIDVMLTGGVVSDGARRNAGRPTRQISAEFMSRKLWEEFATEGDPPPGVASAMKTAFLSSGFGISSWLRTLLTHDDFYTDDVKTGRVRSPVEYVVALLVASGSRARAALNLTLMEGMGQRPLYPPNVDGWKMNGYWVNTSRFEHRARAAVSATYRSLEQHLSERGPMRFGHGSISANDAVGPVGGPPNLSATQFVDRVIQLADLPVRPATRDAAVALVDSQPTGRRYLAVFLLFLAAENNLA